MYFRKSCRTCTYLRETKLVFSVENLVLNMLILLFAIVLTSNKLVSLISVDCDKLVDVDLLT
jgi:hypothetical protein